MVDKNAAEHAAIAAAFPSARILLCDFHRLQAQWRWISSSKSGIKGDVVQERLFKQLRLIGEAATEEDACIRIASFTSCADYTSNAALQRYWRDQWAECLQHWVTCYRQVSRLTLW